MIKTALSLEQARLKVRVSGRLELMHGAEVLLELMALNRQILDLESSEKKQHIQGVVFDFLEIESCDSFGALQLAKLVAPHNQAEIFIPKQFQALFEKVRVTLPLDEGFVPEKPSFREGVSQVGEAFLNLEKDGKDLVDMLGRVTLGLWHVLTFQKSFRKTAFLYHLEHSGVRAVPIIALMAFLIGGILAQQGAFQLRAFGADIFVVNLVGVLVLRELGLLLTAIMVAGRSGSAFTAEIGSMKMREEIDALSTLRIDPVDVLILPRILALMVALPLLTLVCNFFALFGALLMAWAYSGILPEVFMQRLEEAVFMETFLAGLIKSPFMALIIGVIATVEGLRVKGSTDSLGRQTTASVVKAIFMVIVVDGLFAMFYAAINF